jgi:hypothetical protein
MEIKNMNKSVTVRMVYVSFANSTFFKMTIKIVLVITHLNLAFQHYRKTEIVAHSNRTTVVIFMRMYQVKPIWPEPELYSQ